LEILTVVRVTSSLRGEGLTCSDKFSGIVQVVTDIAIFLSNGFIVTDSVMSEQVVGDPITLLLDYP
jgi:hypothetical protein